MKSLKPNIAGWGFVSGRISVLERRFLPREFFLNIIGLDIIGDILAYLQETFLAEYFTPGAAWDDFGALTDRCFHEIALSIRNECPSSIPVDIHTIHGDYLNLRNALVGVTTFPFPAGILDQDKLRGIAAGELEELPRSLTEDKARFINDRNGIDKDIVDIVLDGAYLRHLLMLAEELDSPMISEYVNDRILMSLTSIFWRALNQDIEGWRFQRYLSPLGVFTHVIDELSDIENPETWPAVINGAIGDCVARALTESKDEQVSFFELLATNHLTRLIQAGKVQTAGPERVFSFIAGLNMEMQNLKLVVTGRLNRISKDMLKLKLKDCYV
jgi:V/A-type H+/Na+-transporting ATPase subunit C